MNNILNTSITVSVMRYSVERCRQMREFFSGIYYNSLTYKLEENSAEKIKIWFKYSFFGMLTELRFMDSRAFSSSRILRYLTAFYGFRIIRRVDTSKFASFTRQIREGFPFLLPKSAGIIIAVAFMAYLILSVIFPAKSGLNTCFLFSLFLFMAVTVFICSQDTPLFKDTSIILRFFRKIN